MQCRNRVRQAALPGLSSAGTFHARRLSAATARRRACTGATACTREPKARNSLSKASRIRRGLPTYQPVRRAETSARAASRGTTTSNDPAVAAAIKAVIDRLQLELKVIEKTGFISYFLIVGDFVRYGREQGRFLRGARFRRRFDRHLPAGDLERRSDPLRPAVRTLPESRARQSAGYRHRLCRRPPRGRHRIRARRNTAAMPSRRSSPSARWARNRWCAMSAA